MRRWWSRTSAAAPLYAPRAFERKLGFGPQNQQNQGAFSDITGGNNGLYSAAPDLTMQRNWAPIGTKIAALFVAVSATST
jgi:hypothetical protein